MHILVIKLCTCSFVPTAEKKIEMVRGRRARKCNHVRWNGIECLEGIATEIQSAAKLESSAVSCEL